MRTKQKILFLIFFLMLVSIPMIFSDCRDDATSPTPLTMSLTAEDVGVTDVLIKFRAECGELGGVSFQLRRNGQTIFTLKPRPLAQRSIIDTLLLDDSLRANHQYTYKVYRVITTSTIDSSAPTTITTMDTTSHNFMWEIDSLGDVGSSVLYDVAVVSDTLAFAVGEIYKKDSLGNWINPPYNFARWNGKNWKLSTVLYRGGYAPIGFIFALSEHDIWFGMGYLVHWDGVEYTAIEVPPLYGIGSNKMWANPNGELYVVGNNGTIAFSSNRGSSWQKLASGTNMSLTDIYGSPNAIMIAGIDPALIKGIILRNSGTSFRAIAEGDLISPNEIFEPKLYGYLTSVWMDENNTIYAGGNLLYQYRLGKWDYVKSLPENYIGGNPNVYYRGFIYRIRGNKRNDFWFVGDRNTVRHFNGTTWQQVGLPYEPASDIIWRSIDSKNNFCVAVGDGWNRALCIRMKR